MKRFSIILLALSLSAASLAAAERPRLVVNIVVSRMTSDELRAYANNFSATGFRLFLNDGLCCEEGYFPHFATTAADLATLSTGTVPSIHSITTDSWWDYNSGAECQVIADNSSSSFNCDYNRYRVSNKNLVVPSLGDALLCSSPESKVVTVGGDALSAIVLGGMTTTEVWWLDGQRGKWTTSTRYRADLPAWVKKYNNDTYGTKQLSAPWQLSLDESRYRNTLSSVVGAATDDIAPVEARGNYIAERLISPAANAMVADFAKEAVIYNRLGADHSVDLLNICFDAPRLIEERYGRRSREKEDMYYRLDQTLSELMRFISAQAGGKVLFVLTSDGGSTECDDDKTFNVSQSMFLISSFLSATYGGDRWVLGYSEGNVFLNRTRIYAKGLDLAAVQRQIASFMLQFRGVANTYTASELAASIGVGELAERIQNSFCPKRSGDIVVLLLPGWTPIIADAPRKTVGGSLYDRDTAAPLAFYGVGVKAETIYDRIEMGSLTTSLARIMGISAPAAATSPAIGALVEQFK